MMPNRSFTVLCPQKGVGGAQYLFARIARYLSAQSENRVSVIDYSDGFIASHLSNSNIKLVEYETPKPIHIGKDETVVTALSYFHFFNNHIRLHERSRVFLWDIHPYNLVEHMALSKLYTSLGAHRAAEVCRIFEPYRRAALAKLADDGLAGNGVVFMCRKNFSFNKALLGLTGTPRYLPIPLGVSQSTWAKKPLDQRPTREKKHVDIAWMSRLSHEKLHALFTLMKDVSDYERLHRNERCRLHIIGEGPTKDLVIDEVRRLGLDCKMPGTLLGAELDAYVARYIDIAFAMGTSALEFGARQVPVALTVGGTRDRGNQGKSIYKWLYDSEGYDLTSEPGTSPPSVMSSFAELLQQLQASSRREAVASKCRSYVLQNHGLDGVMENMMRMLCANSFSFAQLKSTGIYNHSLYQQMLFMPKRFYIMCNSLGKREIF